MPPDLINAALARIAAVDVDTLPPRFATMFISAAAGLCRMDHPAVARVLTRVVSLGSSVPQDSLSKAINSLTRHKYLHASTLHSLFRNAVEAAEATPTTPRILATNLHSMARMRMSDESLFARLAELQHAASAHLSHPQDVSMTLYAVTHLFTASPTSINLLRLLVERHIPRVVESRLMSLHGLTFMLSSLAAVARHGHLRVAVDALLEFTATMATQFSPRQTSIVLYAMHRLGRVRDDISVPITASLATSLRDKTTFVRHDVAALLLLSVSRVSPPSNPCIPLLARRITPRANFRDLLWYLHACVRLGSYDASTVRKYLALLDQENNAENVNPLRYGPRAAYVLGALGKLQATECNTEGLQCRLQASIHVLSAQHIAAAMMGLALLGRQDRVVIRMLLERCAQIHPRMFELQRRGAVVLVAMRRLGVTCADIERRWGI